MMAGVTNVLATTAKMIAVSVKAPSKSFTAFDPA